MKVESLFTKHQLASVQNNTQAGKTSFTGKAGVSFKGDTPELDKMIAKTMLKQKRAVLRDALEKGYAIPAFNINTLEQINGIFASVTNKKSPVILQVTNSAIKHAGRDYLSAVVAVARAKAKEAGVPIMLHLDHGDSYEQCKDCIDAGFDSVMYDGSKKDLPINIAETKRVAEYAHARGVIVEAEIGALSGIEDNVDVKTAKFTDPDEAVRMVLDSDCDLLAVSIGTSHGPNKFKTKEDAKLDFDRQKKIQAAVAKAVKGTDRDLYGDGKFPFVLHGASSNFDELFERANKYVVLPRTLVDQMEKFIPENDNTSQLKQDVKAYTYKYHGIGVPEKDYSEAAKIGIAKINIDTDFRTAFLADFIGSVAESTKKNHKTETVYQPEIEKLEAGMETAKKAKDTETAAKLDAQIKEIKAKSDYADMTKRIDSRTHLGKVIKGVTEMSDRKIGVLGSEGKAQIFAAEA